MNQINQNVLNSIVLFLFILITIGFGVSHKERQKKIATNTAEAFIVKPVEEVEEVEVESVDVEQVEDVEEMAEVMQDEAVNVEETVALVEEVEEEFVEAVGQCQTEAYGIQYWCDNQWKKETMDDADIIVLSSTPKVTLQFEQADKKYMFLGQVTKFVLEELGSYQKGFRTEHVQFAGKKAIVVKGFDKEDPQTRYQDYYFLHDNKLTGVKFALSPKEQWDDGKHLIKKVAESFSPIQLP